MDGFVPSKSYPVMSIAKHFGVPLALAYPYAGQLLGHTGCKLPVNAFADLSIPMAKFHLMLVQALKEANPHNTMIAIYEM